MSIDITQSTEVLISCTVPAILDAALLLCSEHHDPPLTGDLSTDEDDQCLPFDNKNCIHRTLGKLHNANLDQFLCQDSIYYKWSQTQEQLDYEDDIGPSLRNAWPALKYHTGNDFPGRDLEMPV